VYPVLSVLTRTSTVVKELRSKMFRQHPEYYKAVFLKKTQTHCGVPDTEWSFQDGGLYIVKKVGVKILTNIVLYRLS
jgi:hypothetical protein